MQENTGLNEQNFEIRSNKLHEQKNVLVNTLNEQKIDGQETKCLKENEIVQNEKLADLISKLDNE